MIGALVKVDDPEIVGFLLSTEIIPLCLRIMEQGTELSKTVATFIVQKILLDDAGLTYICATGERFYAVSSVLAGMVGKLQESPSARLLKHIVRCYLRLSENERARDALRQCLPDALKDQTFSATIVQEDSVQRWLGILLKNLTPDTSKAGPTPAGNNSTAETAASVISVPPGMSMPSPGLGGLAAPPALSKPPGGITAAAIVGGQGSVNSIGAAPGFSAPVGLAKPWSAN